jgi:hypothetical protein
MKLSEYAQRMDLHYKAVRPWWRAGQLGAYRVAPLLAIKFSRW